MPIQMPRIVTTGRRLLLTLIAAFVVLQIADVATTNAVLAQGGWEANPLGAYAIEHFGPWWPAAKLTPMLVAAILMVRWDQRVVAAIVAVMGIVVLNNAFWAFAV